MKYAIVSGSPRGKTSNSEKMAKWILWENENQVLPVFSLYKLNRHASILEELKKVEGFIFIFPLYVDSTPGIVKKFFELMEKEKITFQGKKILFLIHSGFPEMCQSRSLQRYLTYFSTKIMDMNYLGTLIWAGSEALQMAPEKIFQRQIGIVQGLGEKMVKGESITEDLNLQMNKREKMNWLQRFLFRINPLKNFYWNARARKHSHPVNIKARPY